MGKTFKDKKKYYASISKTKKKEKISPDLSEEVEKEANTTDKAMSKNKKKFDKQPNFFREEFLNYSEDNE